MSTINYSLIIPALNEAIGLQKLLPEVIGILPHAEIIIVDDGSEDATREVCGRFPVRLISHPYPKGNGAAIKTGARIASGRILIFLDADGQHQPHDIPALLEKYHQGYDMVVGARNSSGHANLHRAWANGFYNWLAGTIVGRPVSDLTSGFRVVDADKFRRYLHLLPNSFSYPTTITMCFFRAGLSVGYQPVSMKKREGRSHIRPLRDGMRFLLIIFKIGTLYSPLKLFLPISLSLFLAGTGHYLWSFTGTPRFSNMSALLLSTSLLIFLIGLVSEQITMLIYKDSEH